MSSTTRDARTHRGDRRGALDAWPRSGGLMLSATLLAAFVVYTFLVVEWSPFVEVDDYLNRNFHVQALWPVLHVTDRLGQRAVCLPVLAGVTGLVGWRRRTWRPALLGVTSVVLVNLAVGIVKLAVSRGAPLSGQDFFGDGDLYPSGHTSNVVAVYGLCYYLLSRYGVVGPRGRRTLRIGLATICAVMFATSLLLRWHWFSDLVGGFVLGGAVLALIVGLDARRWDRRRPVRC